MKIYISGKISGIDPVVARSAFERAETKILQIGHEPCNPMKNEPPGSEEWDWIRWMDRSIEMLLRCDAIYMIEGWHLSSGARMERVVALERGMRIFYSLDDVPRLS